MFSALILVATLSAPHGVGGSQPGEWCDPGGNACSPAECQRPLNDDEDYGICAVACEPGGSPCPRGMEDVEMTCQDTGGGGHHCHYPGQVPGSNGAACDPFGSSFCQFGPCAAVGSGGGGLCIETCFEGCPAGLECRPWDVNNSYNVCQLPVGVEERDGGCSTSPAASLLVGLAALLVRRRRR